MLAARVFIAAFWPALIVLVAGLLTGRAFCGWLCPLGATIDAFDRLFLGKPAAGAGETAPPARRTKYYVLLGGITAAMFGSAVFAFVDPLSAAVRMYTAALNAAAGLTQRLGFKALPHTGAGLTLLLSFSVVFGPAAAAMIIKGREKGRRFWCRHLCPLGALLGLVGRKAPVRWRSKGGCISCGKCAKSCPTACITSDGKTIFAGECIMCGLCAAACPKTCITFLPEAETGNSERDVDVSRRGIVGGMIAGLFAAGTGFAGSLLRGARPQGHLRPPGAGRDDIFLDRCARCGACLNVCPTGALCADYHRAGFDGIGAPVLIPRLGYCEYDCNLCGRTCPSSAIPRLPLAEKRRTPIGTARFRTELCLPWVARSRLAGAAGADASWVKDFSCLVCEKNCPVPGKAIKTTEIPLGGGQYLQVPHVDDALCIGCGKCEHVCPLEGKAGVHVVRLEREPSLAEDSEELLPPAPPGWTMTEGPFAYHGQKLFDYIGAAAAVPAAYGFLTCETAEYRAPSGESYKLDVYLQDAPQNAYGLYTTRRFSEDRDLYGGVAAQSADALHGVKGRRYVSVAGAAGAERMKLLEAAMRLAGGGVEKPEVLALLPKGARPGSAAAVRSGRVADDYIGLPFLDDLGLGTLAEGAAASYEIEGQYAVLLIIRYRDETAMSERMRGIFDAAPEYGGVHGAVAVDDGPPPVTALMLPERRLCVFASGESKVLDGLLQKFVE